MHTQHQHTACANASFLSAHELWRFRSVIAIDFPLPLSLGLAFSPLRKIFSPVVKNSRRLSKRVRKSVKKGGKFLIYQFIRINQAFLGV
jgi:hypothetical protein